MCHVAHFTIFLFLPSLLRSQSTTPPPSTNLPQECACDPNHIWLDIIIAIDTSSSMTEQGLRITKGFLAGIFDSMSVSQETGRFTRLAIVGFSTNATVLNNLTDINSTNEAEKAIDAIPYGGGNQVNVVPALKAVQDIILHSDQRPNVKNLILVITTALSDDPTPIAHQLKANDDVIVTVAYGPSDGLPPPYLNFASPGFNFTNTDANLTRELLAAFCDSNCFCPNPRWIQFTDSTNKKYGECLYPGDFPTTWERAQSTCRGNFSYLVDELSSEKESFVKNLAINQIIDPFVYWIGLTRINGTWGWDRGINGILPLGSSDYTNWAAGNPTDLGNCTAEQKITGFIVKWKTVACTSNLANDFHPYFCQIRACDTDNYCLGTGDQTTVSPGTGAQSSSTSAATTTVPSTVNTSPTGSTLPTTTLDPNCDLSQLQYDVVFLFDVGSAAIAGNYRLLHYAKNVTISFSTNFTIGSNFGQFVVAKYADDDDTVLYSNFLTYKTHTALNNQISNVINDDDAGTNNLDAGLGQIYTYLTQTTQGFRPNVKHMVIFFSTKAPDNLNAAILAAKNLRNATLCTAGISSGGVDISRVVGGANFHTTLEDPADIPTVVTWLRHLVCTQPACPP